MLGPLVVFLRQAGIRPSLCLDHARIPEQLIAEGGWISKKQAYDFTYEVVQRSECREAVYSAYLDFGFEHLGPVATAMKSCRTVKESLEVGLKLGSTAYEGNEYFLQNDGDTTWICYREPRVISAGQTYINDMTLAVYSQLVRTLADDTWQPDKMLLRQETNLRHREVELFKACNATPHPGVTALGFPTEFLSRRLPFQFHASSDDSEVDWKFGPDECGPNVERLYRLLASGFTCRKTPTLLQVSRMLGTSQATLKRELAASGTNYQGLLDRLRFDVVCQLLSMPETSVKDVAAEAGYADTSNFVRSFRRMTGMTPARYRREHLTL